MIALVFGAWFGISAGVVLTVLLMQWQDRRPQHQADQLENAAIGRYMGRRNVWVS